MTRKEWMEANLPQQVRDDVCGGVIGCPSAYPKLEKEDYSIPRMLECEIENYSANLTLSERCAKCWNREMEVPKK